MALKTGVMAAENFISGINYILKYISIESFYCNFLHNFTVFLINVV